MSTHTQKAFDQLWALQSHRGASGQARGGGTRPTSIPGRTPSPAATARCWRRSRSRRRPSRLSRHAEGPRARSALSAYLLDSVASRRLHDRLALLLGGHVTFLTIAIAERSSANAIGKQQADGGWTIESLGPWMAHADAPPARAATPTPPRSPRSHCFAADGCIGSQRGEGAHVARSRTRIRRPAHGRRCR